MVLYWCYAEHHGISLLAEARGQPSRSTEAFDDTTIRPEDHAKLEERESSVTRKVIVNFSDQTYNTLEAMASRTGKPVAEVLREAIALKTWYETERAQGNRILIETPDYKYRELLGM